MPQWRYPIVNLMSRSTSMYDAKVQFYTDTQIINWYDADSKFKIQYSLWYKIYKKIQHSRYMILVDLKYKKASCCLHHQLNLFLLIHWTYLQKSSVYILIKAQGHLRPQAPKRILFYIVNFFLPVNLGGSCVYLAAKVVLYLSLSLTHTVTLTLLTIKVLRTRV